MSQFFSGTVTGAQASMRCPANDMNQFFKGMATIGQLNPLQPVAKEPLPSMESAWQGVARSFSQTGDSIRSALREFSCAQRENQQAL